MKPYNKKFIIIVFRTCLFILGVMIGMFLYSTFSTVEPEQENTTTKTVTTYIHDTVTHEIKSKYIVVDSQYFQLPPIIDSLSIVNMYFAKYFYNDVLVDSSIAATIIDTISQNKLIGRKFTYNLLKPTVINNITNTTVLKRKKEVFISLFGYANSNYNALGINANYVNDKMIYGVGYDLLNKGVYLQAGFKLYSK